MTSDRKLRYRGSDEQLVGNRMGVLCKARNVAFDGKSKNANGRIHLWSKSEAGLISLAIF